MGRINYALKDRYLLTLTARVDGSSRLAPGKKYSLFPSVAAAWRLSEEPFAPSWLSNLKLRASYGRAGNTAVSPYQTRYLLNRTTYSFGNEGSFGYRPGSLPNAELDWEKTDQLDVGLEFGVLQNRLSGSIDFYRAFTHDLLMRRQLPPHTGFDDILQNIGETRNTGVEVALSGVLLDGWNGLRWSTDLTWATNRNEIVTLYGGKEDDIGNRWFIGQPIHGNGNDLWYDYKFLGIWQLADSAEAKKYRQVPGQIRVQDRGKTLADGSCDFTGGPDGLINACDQTILGNSYPKWTASLSTRVEWKNFDLSAMAITRQGYKVENTFLTSQSQLFGRYNNLKVDYWLPTNPSNREPRPNADQEFPIYGGTRAYQDASFIKIRNITLGFTVPTAWAQRFRAQSLRLYATAQDPFMFSDFVGLDPEGRTGAGTPSYRTLTFGLTLGL
jgi:TonB-linked SusC/RagA family outer membrane protein